MFDVQQKNWKNEFLYLSIIYNNNNNKALFLLNVDT